MSYASFSYMFFDGVVMSDIRGLSGIGGLNFSVFLL